MLSYQQQLSLQRARQWCENALLSLLYFYFLCNHLQQPRWAPIAPILAQESLLAVFFLVRRPSLRTATGLLSWLTAIVGTFLPLLIRAGGSGWMAGGFPLQTVGVTISACALLSLGRSIGIVAAHRGLVTSGLYRVVRHPMYAGHLLTLSGYLLMFPTLRNAAIVGIVLLCMAARIYAEEAVLACDPGYWFYTMKVRWRLLPGVF